MSTLMSLLAVANEQRSRSKSPSGRERRRSGTSDAKPERRESDRKKSSKIYSQSDSDSDADPTRRYRDKKSSKKHHDSDSDDDRRRRRSSRKHDSSDDDDKHRSSTTTRAEEYISNSKRVSRRKSDSDSDSDSHDDRGKRGSKYGSVTPNIVTATPAGVAKVAPSGAKQPVQAQAYYGQPNAYSYAPGPGHVPQPPGAFPNLPHGALSETRHMSYVGTDPRYNGPQGNHTAPVPDPRRANSNAGQQYAQVGQFQYAQVDPRVNYKGTSGAVNAYDSHTKPQILQVDPRHSDSKIADKRYAEDKYKQRETERNKRYTYNDDKMLDKYASGARDSDRKERKGDDKDATRRLSRLSVGGMAGAATLGIVGAAAHGPSNGGGKPPASPLLEAYQGTYQTISPMPSALVLAGHKFDSDISDIELDSGDSDLSDDPEAERKRRIKNLEKEQKWIEKKREKEEIDTREYERKRPVRQQYETRTPDDDVSSVSVASSRMSISRKKVVSWYDAEQDAQEIAAALKGSRPPVVKPLIRILPHLTIDDLDALKVEYKNHATIGGQGINMSKHIKARVTGHLGKAAYACSLGQYESDAYWANCFYQSGASRRELLIESLTGRTNQQIREVKNFFKDKKYDDDLEKCLKAELKADKFRTAILLALEERRQAESPVVDTKLVRNDVHDLYDALHSAGGETDMIHIIVVRSDNHLRAVLRQYEKVYGENFAREMINKHRNLVGETLAHIINGALNRSMRDALLLHQAIAEIAPGKERAELLMSRLIRLHWEPKHLEKVKSQYAQRYRIKVEDAIRKEIQSQMKTEEGIAWTNFCIELIKSSEQQQ